MQAYSISSTLPVTERKTMFSKHEAIGDAQQLEGTGPIPEPEPDLTLTGLRIEHPGGTTHVCYQNAATGHGSTTMPLVGIEVEMVARWCS